MTILSEVVAQGATRSVKEAAQEIDSYVQARLTPPPSLVQYVQRWLAIQRGNNRYGK